MFLKGIISRKDLLIRAMRIMKVRYLSHKNYKAIYHAYQVAYANGRTHLDTKQLFQLAIGGMKEIDEKEVLKTYDLVVNYGAEFTEETFTASVDGLLQIQKEKILKMLTEELKETKNIQQAEKKTRDFLLDIKRLEQNNLPVSLATSSQYMMDEYEDTDEYVFDTFSPRINQVTGGGKKGELWLIEGYQNDGKTMAAMELIRHSAIDKKKKVLWIPLEGTIREMRQRWEVRRAWDLELEHITSRKIRDRVLAEKEICDYQTIQKDLARFDNLVFVRPHDKYTIDDVEMEIDRMKNYTGLDIVVVDCLEWLEQEQRMDYRIWVKRLAWKASQIATRKDVWFISPWQVNRDGRRRAEERAQTKKGKLPEPPYYTPYDMQESGGLEQNAKVVMWIFQDDNMRVMQEARIGLGKVKDEDFRHTKGWGIKTDLAHCRLIDDSIEDKQVYE